MKGGKRKKKENIYSVKGILIIAAIFLLLLTPYCLKASANTSTLEIAYPNIPGTVTPTTVSSGLPDYIKYIFNFSIFIIGFIVFGVMIYNGIQYLSSAGNPEKLSEAKKGISSSLLGALILLSSVLLFNTINPKLTVFEAPEPAAIMPVVTPGIYLCDYKISNIDVIIGNYTSGSANAVKQAVKDLRRVMDKKENGIGTCFKVNSSGNLKNFTFDLNDDTFFIIPQKSGTDWEYNFGIIFHEKNNFQGKCKLANIYSENNETIGYSFDEFGTSRSITFFQKPNLEPEGYEGVILYQCLHYNEPTLCPKDVTSPGYFSCKPQGTELYTKESKDDLKAVNMIPTEEEDYSQGPRSIKIDPVGSYFAVLFSDDQFKGDKCEIIHNSDPNLLDQPIGRCGSSCWFVLKETEQKEIKNCWSCINSMFVVKGKVL